MDMGLPSPGLDTSIPEVNSPQTYVANYGEDLSANKYGTATPEKSAGTQPI